MLLSRQSDGKWLDSSYYDLPVDFGKLSRFTDDLASAKVQRLVTRNPEVLARLDFKDTTIALLDATGKNLRTLTLGKEADSGGRFVKFDDDAKGYLANLTTFLDADAKNWADSLLIDLKPDDIAAMSVGFGDGEPVVATRAKKDGAWTAGKAPAGQRVDGEKITSLLSSFTSLRFQDTSGLDDPNVEAARQHSRTIKLTTFDHKTITIQLGRKPEEKKPEERKETGERKPDTGKPATGPMQNPPSETQNPAASPAKPEEKPGNSASPAGAASASNPEPNLSAVAPAKAETQNPEPSVAPAVAAPAAAPAGPVYAFITSSDPAAPVNALMKKRAFQVYDWNYTSLPQKPDELFEALSRASPAAESRSPTAGRGSQARRTGANPPSRRNPDGSFTPPASAPGGWRETVWAAPPSPA